MKKTVSATEARVHFGELMRSVVASNEPVIVERDGTPQVVIISVEKFGEYQRPHEGLRARPQWEVLLERAWEQNERDGDVPLTPSAEDVIREMRDERDAQLMDLR